MNQFSVRPLSTDDAQAFRNLRLEGLRNHPEAFGADFEEESQRPMGWFEARLQSCSVFGGFNKASELCGVVAIARGQGAKTAHIASIWGMYVSDVSRGKGLSKLLLDAAVSYALEHCSNVRLTVVESNHAARRLCAAAGFREWAVDVAALEVGDVFHDEIMMRLDKV